MHSKGAIKIRSSIICYAADYFEAPGSYGIDGGRISKLIMTSSGKVIASYDEIWEVMPEGEDAEAALQILMKEYN